MIPKKIHYFWFGKGEKNALTLHCIASWKKHQPDFEIIEWTEENFDVNSITYTKEAYEKKNGLLYPTMLEQKYYMSMGDSIWTQIWKSNLH